MKLGIDLDGCMYPFVKNLRDYAMSTGSVIPEEPATSWEFYKKWGWSTAEFLKVCEEGVNAGFIFNNDEPPEKGSVEALENLMDEGHSINLITHREFGNRSIQNTADWLHSNSVPFDTITFAEDKTIVGVDLLLDDALHNFTASQAAKIPCVLMDRPWNQETKELDHPAPRVYSWADFEAYVEFVDSFAERRLEAFQSTTV